MKPQDAEDYLMILQALEKQINRVQALPEYLDPRLETDTGVPERRSYQVLSKAENPLNAWSHKARLARSSAIGKAVGMLTPLTVYAQKS